MKELNYYYPAILFKGNVVSIPSTIQSMVIKKQRLGLAINIIIIAESKFMKLNWNEVEFLSYSTSIAKYNNYHQGDYKFLWLDFIPSTEEVFSGTVYSWNWELALMSKIDYSWYNFLRDYLTIDFKTVIQTLISERRTITIYPEQKDILKVFKDSDINKIRVVILGQDPYQAGNYATGIPFAIDKEIRPKSLIEIEKAIKKDYPDLESIDLNTSMEHLIEQGVFLFNTSLTVQENKLNSHNELWKPFVDLVISVLCTRPKPVIFVLLGKEAGRYEEQINKTKHASIVVEHPIDAVIDKRDWVYNNLFNEVDLFVKQNKTKNIKWLKL